MNGFINVLKPPGMTSHDVVSWMRRSLGIKKIGHAGTLDPGAAGVLVLAVGQGTRLLEYLTGQAKSYRCEILLGITTDSQDLSGKILKKRPVPDNYKIKFADLLHAFTGEIQQIPPMISAVHHKGKRLYELARQGVYVEREPRTVTIYSIKIVAHEEYQDTPTILFDVACSKGTYIRTLCHDMGEALGCGGTMAYLLRTSSGPFKIEQAWTLEEITAAINKNSYDFLLPYKAGLQEMASVVVNEKAEKKALNGIAVKQQDIIKSKGVLSPKEPLCIYNKQGRLLATGFWKNKNGTNTIKLSKVFKNEV